MIILVLESYKDKIYEIIKKSIFSNIEFLINLINSMSQSLLPDSNRYRLLCKRA